ncbi:hypothetical protein HPB48_014381 [Haemaphysalis longicornis]|uniref:Uncharacterized protein n=1 Tax=Haemaphysalis longicornis TaxID=44386 RepID=A0A9J6GF00_HAELO|nr:hypothetical protein HPB48_014381 [Haemaphysalis longicornis]
MDLSLGNPRQRSLYHHHTATAAQETTQQRYCQTNKLAVLEKGRRGPSTHYGWSQCLDVATRTNIQALHS